MKTNIDGIEVEGTPDEILEFIKIMSGRKKEKVIVSSSDDGIKEKRPYKHSKKKYIQKRTWSRLTEQKRKEVDKVVDYMIKHPDVKMTKVMWDLNHKNISSYGNIVRKRLLEKSGGKSSTSTSNRTYDTQRQRMSFISSRASSLMKQYNYSREKACQIASQEWKNGGSLVTSSKTQNKPKYDVLTGKEDMDKILIQMLANIAKNNGELRYPRDANTIGINSVEKWRQIVTKILSSVNIISKTLNVENKFSVGFIESTPLIKYG